MHTPLAGWRLPLRLAWRDLLRYKGRSALAALLILLPVGAMAAMLTFATTFSVSTSEQLDQKTKDISALVEVAPDKTGETFPAAGRVISSEKPPTAAQVAKQAGAPAAGTAQQSLSFAPAPGGRDFTPTFGNALVTEATNAAWHGQLHLVSGRWPQRNGEVVVTEFGANSGLPSSGTLVAHTQDASTQQVGNRDEVRVVGVSNTPDENIMVIGPSMPGSETQPAHSFIVANTRSWSSADEAQWHRYGLDVMTPEQAQARAEAEERASSNPKMTPEEAFAAATATMAFICVTAMLAGPAFAAGATRQRRSLGLVAANGGTRSSLRRVVLANALLLGSLTSAVAAAGGSVVGVLIAQWWTKRATGIAAPADIPFRWLAGLILVSTAASLLAAWIPARAAGRTNLLQALRGQVSPRRVPRVLPVIGVLCVLLGIGCLFLATTLGGSSAGLQALLAYVGVPLFFGGAVLAVPYFLAATSRLAGYLPISARVAVRDVSRQRTRATASIGAVLATIAIFTGASVFATSVDARDRAYYRPSMPMHSAALTLWSSDPKSPQRLADERAEVAELSKLSTGVTGVWSTTGADGLSSVSSIPCPKAGEWSDPMGPAIAALDEDSSGRLLTGAMKLNQQQRSVLDRGGVLWVTWSDDANSGVNTFGSTTSVDPVQHDTVSLAATTWTTDKTGMPSVKTCSPFQVPAAHLDHAQALELAGAPMGGFVIKRSTLEKRHLATRLTTIAINPEGGVDSKLEHQLQAAAPGGATLTVEKGYESPLLILLTVLAAGLATIVLLTTVVSTLLNDAESQADAATLATVGAPTGMRRRIVGAHAAAIGVIGSAIGIIVGIGPGLILAHVETRQVVDARTMELGPGTYVIPWIPLALMLIGVPMLAALISMVFARRNPTLTRRER